MDRSWSESAWRAIAAKRRAFALRWRGRVRALFHSEGALLASRADDWESVLRGMRPRWRALLLALWRDAAEHFGTSLASRLGARVDRGRKDLTEDDLPVEDLPPWDYEPWPRSYARRIARLVSRKANEIVDSTRRTISRAVSKVEGAVSDVIASVYSRFQSARSWFVTDEETHQAASVAEEEAARASGLVTTKTWLTQRDERVRASHRNTDGERVPFEDRYSNGLRYPRDPEGPMREIAGCRCYQVFGYSLPS